MANEFKVRKGLIVQGSGSNIFDVQGSQGQLFSVTDSLSGSLFSVNDISGIPIMEVFSDNTIKMGTFNQEAIIISGSRTGMGTALPQAELHISGANNDSLFRIQSPASASIMFVSGSGLVGIGTLTPTQKISVDNGNVGFTSGFGISWDSDTEWVKRAAAADQLQFATGNTVRLNIGSTQGQLVAIGLGTTAASAQFQVRGGGATAATTAMRIEDSGGNARLTILDNGTSAFNTSHLYVSSSGNVGIGLTSPLARLHISGASNSNLLQVGSPTNASILFVTGSGRVGIGTGTPRAALHVSAGDISLDGTRYLDWANGDNRIIGGSAGGYSLQFQTYTGAALTEKMRISGSGEVGIGVTNMTAKLHVSGASNAGLFEIDSPTINNILFVSGSGRVGIGTGTPNATLQIAGTLNNGSDSTPLGIYSHTEGRRTSASAEYSHAEGYGTSVLAPYSHAEGYGARVELINGEGAAHAEGLATIASGSFQHVQGQHNRATQKQSAFIIGNGTDNTNARKNLVEINPTDGISDFFGPVRITRTAETSTQDPDKLRNEDKAGIIYMGFEYLFNTPNRGPSPPIAVKINNTATGGTNYGKLRHPYPTTGFTSYYTKISHTSTNQIGSSIQSANATLSDKYEVINTGIFTDGAVTAQEFRALGSFSVSSTSDIRLKENINDMDIDTALKLIENVKPVTFNWKRPEVGDNTDTINGKYDVGVIAQDVLKNGFEHLVRIAENTLVPEHIDDEGYVSKEGCEFGVSYVGMIPYHAKVIKYLLDEIRELKSQIKLLEKK